MWYSYALSVLSVVLGLMVGIGKQGVMTYWIDRRMYSMKELGWKTLTVSCNATAKAPELLLADKGWGRNLDWGRQGFWALPRELKCCKETVVPVWGSTK